MYLTLSLPILIINTLLSGYAFYDIYKNYKYTTFKPRLVMMALIIFSNLPYSLVFIFPDIFTNGFLKQNFFCYLYVFVTHFYLLKILALMTIPVLIMLIMFTKYSVRRLNKIGWILNLGILFGFLLIELVLIPIDGVRRVGYDKLDTKHTHPKRCISRSDYMHEGIVMWQTIVSFIAISISVILILINHFTNKPAKGTSANRIAVSFLFLSIVNVVSMVRLFINLFYKKELSQKMEWALLDIGKLAPALFSIIYLLTETTGRSKSNAFGIDKVLKNKKCRNLYKEYLADIGAKKGVEMVNKWECVYHNKEHEYEILGRTNLNRKEALDYIKKHLELDLYGFLLSDLFNDFYVVYKNTGNLEADLKQNIVE